MRRRLLALLVLFAACARTPARTPEPVPGPDEIGIRVVNQSAGSPIVWLDPGRLQHRVGDLPPDTTAVLLFPIRWLEGAPGIVRVYPVPFVCFFSVIVGRQDTGRVLELRVPPTDEWPAPDSTLTDSDPAGVGRCDSSDIAFGEERLRAARDGD